MNTNPKQYIVIIEQCDDTPIIGKMTKEEILNLKNTSDGTGWMVIDGEILKSFDSQLQVNQLKDGV